MNRKKPKLYIIPGWGEKITMKGYKGIVSFTKERYEVVPLNFISKKGLLFSENIKIVDRQINKVSSKDIILGFSAGALIAYKMSVKFKFKLAIICSISAIIENDLSMYPKKEVDKIFTKSEINDLNKIKYGKAKSKTIFIIGSNESKEVISRSKKLYEKNNSTLIYIGNQGHSFSGKYVDRVKKEIFDIS
ncbi:hypothetical protein IT402_00860 [Candidatus Nomurabacteria bacterium]|nr:hypothetical protein [Candidatus Nomurabacteria bacterium]